MKYEPLHKAVGDTVTDQIFSPDPQIPGWLFDASDLPIFEQRGPLTVRLARTSAEVAAVQALRYQIFYEEMSARPSAAQAETARDFDDYDAICDHLILTTREATEQVTSAAHLPSGETIVGCYRLLRQWVAETHGGFYSAGEFDLKPMLENAGRGLNIMELGRSCVAPEYRTKHGIDLMWHGLGAMVSHYGIDAMMGCASFAGTDVAALTEPLSYLYHTRRTLGPWEVRALPERFVDMNILPPDAINERAALRAMPPVLRGYVRTGCMIGNGAVIDRQFQTVDVFVLMPLTAVEDRYMARFGQNA